MRCSNCSSVIFDGTNVCPSCGAVNDLDELNRQGGFSGTEANRQPLPDPTVDRADTGEHEEPLDTQEISQRSVKRAVSEATSQLPPVPEPSGPNRRDALRSKMGAPRPAMAPAPDDATAIGEPTEPPARATSSPRSARPDTAEDLPAASEPRPTREARGLSGPKKKAGKPARPRMETEPATEEDVPNRARKVDRMAAEPLHQDSKVAPPKSSGKYASVKDDREAEMTMARPELQKNEAAAPPPVNPDELAQAAMRAFKQMGFEDRLESISAIVMLMLTFMPWRSVRGESDIGLATGAGFMSLIFAAGVLGLVYLRITGRVPTLPAKMLSQAELGLSALQVPITLIFIFSNIDRHQTQYGSLATYASMPDFGSILSMVANFALCAGAALVMQRESRSVSSRR
ncbi:MAG: hypothetical protein JST54_22280 [Deltaproteobacteria bacterium]|nr:hypothetical protein [Deltaproteobacteria bacterium]